MKIKKQKNKNGFTLMELLISLGILGVIFSIFLLTANPVTHFANQRNVEREGHLKIIMDAIDRHKLQHGGSFSCPESFADLSGNNNFGVCSTEECPEKIDGRFGVGAGFDGSNENIKIESSDNLDVQGNMTISFWVKPSINSSEFSSGWNYFLIYEDNLKFELGFFGTAGPRFKVYNSGGSQFEVDANTPFSAGDWQHIVAVREGSFVGIYVNGVLKNSREDFSGTLRSGGALKIGGNGSGNGFDGVVEELVVYNKALSSEDIGNLFSGLMPEGPVLFMNFSEPADTVPVSTTTIASESEGGLDISCLVPTFLKAIPLDPSSGNAYYNSSDDYNTGYEIIKNETTGRITLMAPSAELDKKIEVTR